MATQTITSGVQYSGIWSLAGQANAKALGTWPSQPPNGLSTWGRGGVGALGLNNTTDYSSPKQVGLLTTWTIISMGNNVTLALASNGTLWSWGSNAQGTLGLNNGISYSSPKQVGSLTTWSKIHISSSSSFAIKTDGTLWAWGKNTSGELGLGDVINRSSPVQIGALTTWATVVSGTTGFGFALKTNGTLWSWGINGSGQLGLGNVTYTSSPKQVGLLTNWAKITAGPSTGIAIKTDGTLWIWGNGGSGQLGLGNTTSYSSPKQVGALTTWAEVYGCGSSAAIKIDGTLWVWGLNNKGQLGLGNITNYSSPKQLGSLTNWKSVVIGASGNSLGLSTSGVLQSWGNNSVYGALGLGNLTSYSSPKQIGQLTNWSSLPLAINQDVGGAIAGQNLIFKKEKSCHYSFAFKTIS